MHTATDHEIEAAAVELVDREQQGRRWLTWSFIFCPCHLPVSMAVSAAMFGGSTLGALISRNTLGVGLILGAVYAIGVAIGFSHLRLAKNNGGCGDRSCAI